MRASWRHSHGAGAALPSALLPELVQPFETSSTKILFVLDGAGGREGQQGVAQGWEVERHRSLARSAPASSALLHR